MVTNMLPNTILEVTEENTKHFKCVSIPMFMQIMQMSLRVSHSLHLPYQRGHFGNKGSILTLHYGSKLTNKGSFFTIFVKNGSFIS